MRGRMAFITSEACILMTTMTAVLWKTKRELTQRKIPNPHLQSQCRTDFTGTETEGQGEDTELFCPLTEEQCRTLMAGETPEVTPETPALLNKLILLMKTSLMRPKVIVEYDRVPYIYPLGNVRITLDEDIRGSSRVDLFLEDQIPLRLIMPAGQHILEVKYDEYLPDFIYQTAQLDNLRTTAFSKYYLCRKYNL